MALKTESRGCNGIEVTCTQFPVIRALKLYPRVAQRLAPALIVGEAPDDRMTLLLFAEMLPDEAEALAIDLLASSTARVDGREVSLAPRQNLEAVFQGQLPALFKAAMFAAEVNFGGFFDAPSREESSSGGDPRAAR